MIVWIINGKTKSVKDAVDYVADDNKTAKRFDEARAEYEMIPEIQADMSLEEYYLSCEDNINRTLNYIGNEDKVGGYISGYLCNPTSADKDFRETKEANLSRIGKSLWDDNGNYFYHIIQSFPEELDISDDEVHQCGVELVERLGLYQAVIASHVHPTIDEENNVHGRCKHNHIIINSHIYHEFVDPNNPYKMKYNNCDKTYAQLQHINDLIAIEHGLPIIINPEKHRSNSWYESDQKTKGIGWKQHIRTDINGAMRCATDLNSYMEIMEAIGYQLRLGHSRKEGDYITYTSPDGKNVIRDFTLGRGCTVGELNAYWDLKYQISEGFPEEETALGNRIAALVQNASEPIFIKFVKQTSKRRKEEGIRRNLNIKDTYTNYFPIGVGAKKVGKAELTYFDALKTYEIVNQQYQTMMEVEGAEILAYFNRLRELEKEQEKKQQEEMKKKQEQEYYSRPDFWNSKYNRPYQVGLYDKYGRKRTIIELLVMLALVVIKNEGDKWMSSKDPTYNQVAQRDPIYATRDWRAQNMIDTIELARAEKVHNLGELEDRLNAVGKDLSKARAECKRLTASKNRMDVLNDAINGYNEVRAICEEIHAMPDGPEKTRLQEKYADEIKEYKENKAVMYRHNVSSESEIADFLVRYQEISEKIPVAEEHLREKKEEYRRLSKLHYNIQLAQSKQYCYGPAYKEPEREPQQEPGQEQTEERDSQNRNENL